MRRRAFITSVGAAAAWPLVARAQVDRVRRVGVLMTFADSDPESRARLEALAEGLHALGWSEGRNLKLDIRSWGGDSARVRSTAKELVELGPDVIVATTSPTVAAFLEETRVIPTVFVVVTDPVGQKFVTSLAHPGGNVTGFSNYDPAMGGKWLDLLKQVAPHLERVVVMFNPEAAPHAPLLFRSLEAASAPLSLALTAAPVHSDAEIEQAVAAMGRDAGSGLLVMVDAFMSVHREAVVAAAARHRVPAIYPYSYFATVGGLISYGIDPTDLYRRAASYVDLILKGAKPADLPVQYPTKFELVVNLKTAKALGLAVPGSLLHVADEVIE